MRQIIFVLCCLLAWPVQAKEMAGQETIVVAADGWCPYNCTPESVRPGFIIELLQEAMRAHGIHVIYRRMPWPRAIEDARQGKINGIVAASYEDAPDFVFPALEQGWMKNVFYARSDSNWHYAGVDSLEDVSLGVAMDYTYGDGMDEYIAANERKPDYVQPIGGDDVLATNVKKLMAGRIDALLEDEMVMTEFLSQQSEKPALKVVGHLPCSKQSMLFVAFSPKNKESQRYAEILARETAAMRADGRLEKLLARYGVKDWIEEKHAMPH